MKINNQVDAKALLQQVARMSVKAGEDIKNGAGWGYVGMMNGMVVKMGTHYSERHGDWAKNETMIRTACDQLRASLGDAMKALNLSVETQNKIREQLGLGGKEGTARAPLTRSIVLQAVKDIAKASNAETILTNLKGAATIKNSGADDIKQTKGLTSQMGALAEQRDLLFAEDGKFTTVLNKLLPGKLFAPKRNHILEFAKNQFQMTSDGKLGVRRSGSDLSAEKAIAALTNGLRENASDEQIQQLEKAVGFLFEKTQTKESYDDLLAQIKPCAMPKRQKVQMLTIPKELSTDENYSAQDSLRFERFKSVAILHPSVEGNPKKYSAYGTWLLEAAIEYLNKNKEKESEPDKTLQSLNLHDMDRFLDACKDIRPDQNDILTGKNDGHFLGMTAGNSIKDALGGAKGDTPLDQFKNFLQALEKPETRKNVQAELMLGAAINGQSGGLVFEHKETFELENGSATSVITPARTQQDAGKQLHNLASTQLTVKDNQGGKQTVFHGLRFGSHGLNAKSPAEQKPFYGQLVEQTFLQTLANNEGFRTRVNALHDGDSIDLPVVRIDMSDDAGLSTFADKYTIELEGKTVTVRPQVAHFRIPTDNAQYLKLDEENTWCVMSGEDIRKTTLALEMLKDQIKENPIAAGSKADKLWQQIKSNWNQILDKHGIAEQNGEGKQAVEFYKNCGADMMRLGAMIGVLANELGLTPAINCDGGRDRTGLMDTECKTLALWLRDDKPLSGLEENKKSDDPNGREAKVLRDKVRNNSGNQDIARDILLNDGDMLMMQAKAHAKKQVEDLRLIPQEMQDHSSGLDALYP